MITIIFYNAIFYMLSNMMGTSAIPRKCIVLGDFEPLDITKCFVKNSVVLVCIIASLTKRVTLVTDSVLTLLE